MPLGSTIAPYLPFLRRYARALCGDQPSGDALVLALLESALSDALLRAQLKGGRIELYRSLGAFVTSGSVRIASSEDQLHELRRTMSRIATYGVEAELLSPAERFDRFAEATAICRGLLDGGPVTVSGRWWSVRDAVNDPPPVQARLPLLLGGSGERRTIPLVARYADAVTVAYTPGTSKVQDVAGNLAAGYGATAVDSNDTANAAPSTPAYVSPAANGWVSAL